MVCRNPLLAKERARKREDLLRAAETALEAAAEATKRNRGEKNISERVGRAVYKMKKHLEIAADTFSWRRNDDSIAAEAALDGFYVPACRRNSSTLARPLPPTKISVLARSAPSSSSTSTCGQSITAWKAVCAPICCYACWPVMSNATCASSLHQC